MKPVNLYTLTRISDPQRFSSFESVLSVRESIQNFKEHEINGLRILADQLFSVGKSLPLLDGFFFSYRIPQISKEFDLLRIGSDSIVNIELKSGAVPTERIEKQLTQNRYYLAHTQKRVLTFCYISKQNRLFQLDDDLKLSEQPISELVDSLAAQGNLFDGNIDTLFRPADFLVSPINTPSKFLQNQYFLTSHQEKIKNQIVALENSRTDYQFIGITGGAGTGKTLLLYDLAVTLSEYGKCCIVHCGIMAAGHLFLHSHFQNVDIVEAKNISELFDFSPYSFILVDESQRIHLNQYRIIVNKCKTHSQLTIFSYDAGQTLSNKEQNADIATQVLSLDHFTGYSLTDKIRTNRELVSFIRRLDNLHSKDIRDAYPSVEVLYAEDISEAQLLISYYRRKGYQFINFTGSNYYSSNFDCYSSDTNTHRVVGQEFDNVLMVMDSTFYYDSNYRLKAKEHPNPNYLYTKLLLQGLTRVREKLALIIVGDTSLFDSIIGIVTPKQQRDT